MKTGLVFRTGLITATLFVAPMACGIDGPPPNANATAGSGGSNMTTVSSSSSSSSGQQDPPKKEPSCEDPPEGFDPNLLEPCPTNLCAGGARCVPKALVESNSGQGSTDMLAPCDQPDSLCVPDEFIKTGGFFTPTTCKSVLGAEGRCLSTCVPEVKTQNDATPLPQDICPEFQVCVPCYDPQTGESTDACTQSCDKGPVEDPILLPECCGGNGKCVPKSAVPPAQLTNLGDYACSETAGADFVCAPNVFIEDLNFKPQACSQIGFLAKLFLPPDKQDGRCLPDCLPKLDEAPVSQGDCQPGFMCTPCWEPQLLGGGVKPTGACDYD